MPVVDASVVVDWVAPDADPALPALAALERLAADEAELLAPPTRRSGRGWQSSTG